MEITDMTLTQARRALERHEFSAHELTQAYLDRIETYDPALNSYICVTRAEAEESAQAVDQALSSGKASGSLAGIPIALKDLFDMVGVPTTAGSPFFREAVPERDAAVVEKLRQAGAVLLGKLNMHEIALGVTSNNPHFGPVHNPWKLDRSSGGSSGGSGAALAARLCLGSFGSDTGGSIRIPASLCGVVGLKPTYGRISLRGVLPLSWNLDHPGPMGRNVEDVAYLLQATAGYDPSDPSSANQPVDDYLSGLKNGVQGLRIALAEGEYFSGSDVDVEEGINRAARAFSALGARVETVEVPGIYEAAFANGRMVVADAAAFHRQRLDENPYGFGEDVLRRLQQGQALTSSEYVLIRRTQQEMRRTFEHFCERYDLLLLPTTPVTAPLISGPDAVEQARRLTRFTAPFNLTGLPAISIPCGLSREGLPIGLQLVARPWAEAQLLQAAYAFEQTQPEFGVPVQFS